MTTPDEVLAFWFPPGLDKDEATFLKQIMWWFRGGADEEIRRRFADVTEQALDGGLVEWEKTMRDRQALILVLDQFPRSSYRESPRAFAGAARAEKLATRTLDAGEHESLPPHEQMFLAVPLGHSEDLALHDRSVALAESLGALAPPYLAKMYEISAGQARGHQEVIRRFGRHPHRNQVLGRESTQAELDYLKNETPPHQRNVSPSG
jgi:uncharacterized protein (DUF924 family)